MENKVNYITFIVIISVIIAVFMLIIIIDLVYIYRNKKKDLEQKMEFERKLFQQEIERKENQNLQKIINALEEERSKISQEIHDRIGAGISTVKIYFEGIMHKLDSRDQNITQSFEKATDLLDHTIEEVRFVSRKVTSGFLNDFGLDAAIQDLAETISESGKMEMVLKNKTSSVRYQKDIEINVYRVIQELVNNAIRHSKASTLIIEIHEKEKTLEISYKDNGIGFDKQLIIEGAGLKNINNRIQSLNGSYDITSNSKEGTNYKISIPLKYKDHD